MSSAIIRNAKCKMSNMQGIGRHNERQNKEYGNKDIDVGRSHMNYHLVQPQEKTYEKEFYRLKEKNDLQGKLRLTGKKQSNVVNEFLITSDKVFFDKLGEVGTREFFKDSLEFVADKCGMSNIISAVVHMDETTPHMHVTYIPVVEAENSKGQLIKKVNSSEFWKGFNSYGELQDRFHEHVTQKGYDLVRGDTKSDKRHLSVLDYKIKTKTEELGIVADDILAHKNRLKEISAIITSVEDIPTAIKNIDAVNVKYGVIDKKKVTISADDFENMRNLAKKGIAYEPENVKLKTQLTNSSKLLEEVKGENSRIVKEYNDLTQKARSVFAENKKLKTNVTNMDKAFEILKEKYPKEYNDVNKLYKALLKPFEQGQSR